MALRGINKEAVLQAIRECDRLGREAFLQKYGFKASKSHLLVFEGKRYDSKAILGAAHGFAHPDRGPLSARAFSGGATVQRRLTELGFSIQAAP